MAFKEGTPKARSRATMRHVFEIFMTCGGDWHKASLVYGYRSSASNETVGEEVFPIGEIGLTMLSTSFFLTCVHQFPSAGSRYCLQDTLCRI